MTLRKTALYLLDHFKGGLLSQYLNEIEAINMNPYGFEQKKMRKESLESLLTSAMNNTQFYSQFKSKHNIGLKGFPIINKQLIKQNYSEFVSKEFKDLQKLKLVSTSGSTGEPFEVHQSQRKVIRNRADNIFFGRYANYVPGNPLYYLRIWNHFNREGFFKRFIKNTREIDVSDLSDESLKSIINAIQNVSTNAVILGYGSAFQALGDYIIRNKVNSCGSPGALWVMAEPVSLKVKDVLKKCFNCPVVMRYSNAENGFIAHQFTEKNEDYMLNTASYIIELLELDSDKPVLPGDFGRVVITDLFNEAVPMIRYDTGDIAVGGEKVLGRSKIPVLEKIEGRQLDFITNTKGELISPHTVDYAVRKVPDLVQFQLSQESEKEYLLKIVSRNYRDGLKYEAAQALKKYLGDNSVIKIEIVTGLPVLKSGKRKMVENNYRNVFNA